MNWLRDFYKKVKTSIVEDCPSESFACEVCHELDCTNERWLNCSARLDAAEYMEGFKRIPVAEFICEYQIAKNDPTRSNSDLDAKKI